METKSFLQRVLPAKGTEYYGAAGDANGFRQSKPLTDIDALVNESVSNAKVIHMGDE